MNTKESNPCYWTAKICRIVFFAYLKGASVSSFNDGRVWRSDPDGSLHLLAREGKLANSTDGAVYAQLNVTAANDTGGVLIFARLRNGIGDTEPDGSNALGIWRDRGAADPALVLVMRKKATFAIAPADLRKIGGVGVDFVTNPVGGTGGYGRVLNDSGGTVMKLSLSGGSVGVFTLP